MIKINFNPEIDKEKTTRILREIRADKMSGFLDLPKKMYGSKELQRVKKIAEEIRAQSDVLVCIGIGGSYLGHRAIIEALRPQLSKNSGIRDFLGLPEHEKKEVQIIYAGNSLSRRELDYALRQVGDKDFSINVISKSGMTLEPAVAFKEFKRKLIEKYGEAEAVKRIYATTDANFGRLHDEAVAKGYTCFTVPNNVGGRYSVLSEVSLLPLVVAGVDVDELLSGAAQVLKSPEAAVKYAWMRYILGKRGYDTEVFASFEPSTAYFNEWIKQLFGESEGKKKQGILPTSLIYSTDLHSLGQFMQDGRRNLFETIVDFPTDDLNAKVVEAVRIAHIEGRIPVLDLAVPTFNERGFGESIMFFELACAVSAKLFGVNPFDQPGVEAYKKVLHQKINGF